MKRKRLTYLVISIITFSMGISLVVLKTVPPLIRGNFGDFLIVIFIYASLKICLPEIQPLKMSVSVFLFSAFIEFIQLLRLDQYLSANSLLIDLTLGKTFDWIDIFMYFSGCVIIFLADKYFICKK